MIYIINDIHLGLRNSNEIFHQEALRVSRKIREDVENSGESSELFILGDIYDNRASISLRTMEVSNEFFENLQCFDKIYVIPGNHDIHFVNSLFPNSIEHLLARYDNIEIFFEPTRRTIQGQKFLFMPWVVPSHNEQAINILKSGKADEICLGHFDIQGFYFNTRTINTNHGFSQKVFKNFRETWSGHYHIKSSQNNITFLGTQYQMTWDDHGERKAYHKFSKGELETVETGSRLFRTIKLENEIPENFKYEDYRDSFVRLYFDNIKQQDKNTFVSELSRYAHKIATFDSDEINKLINLDEEKKIDAESNVLKSIIDAAEDLVVDSDKINKEELVATINEIVQEAIMTMAIEKE